MNQLSFMDILDRPAEPKQPAEIAVLPTWLRARVRKAAAEILNRPADKQAWHFRDQASLFRNQLLLRGVDLRTATDDMVAFAAALDVELKRQAVISYLYGTTGDAA